ncbi:MAG: formylmethanofuran dehydrogenase subunit A [Candidatus Thorarchaeota archaeon]
MTDEILLKGGVVYDPLNGINGEEADIAVRDGKIVDRVSHKAKVYDLDGRAVLPGGVDLHSHIIGSKIGTARAMTPEYHRTEPVPRRGRLRSGVGSVLPSSFVIGYRYSQMGYTTVIDPAIPAVKALGAWEEVADVPLLDVGMLSLFSNSMLTFHYIQEDDMAGLAAYIAWTLGMAGGYGVKVVNPGGTYAWAHHMNVHNLDETIPDWEITPRQILRDLVSAVERLGLPHTVHLHPNNLGAVGNIETTIAQLEAVRGIRGHRGRPQVIHLTHISFESLGCLEGEEPEWKNVVSGGLELAEYANRHNHFTADLGQIAFGPAMTMTADGPFQFRLYGIVRGKWSNIAVDVELPGGAGVVPYTYSPKLLTNSVQWMISLEYALSVRDLWRCVITTDSPNAAPFTQYPLIISWLMSKKQRSEWIQRIHPAAAKRSTLPDIEREWSLYDVAVSTRAAPARILGLERHKGHLGVGADADIAVLDVRPNEVNLAEEPKDIVKIFSKMYMTFKHGVLVAKGETVVADAPRHVFTVRPVIEESTWDRVSNEVESLIDRWYAHSHDNYAVPARYRTPLEAAVRVRGDAGK